ncbi:MAG: glycosyltransferase family 4 protein [Candidatus Ancaeobacter aquaticus]|nr:glycosyltransferase family 4 protein [Candidatus Ancaeobacter aquaticus]
MKIAILIDQLIPGGVQKIAVKEVQYLRLMGVDATLLVIMRVKDQEKYISMLEGVPCEYISDRYPKYLRRTIKLPVFHFLSTLHLLSPYLAPRYINKNEYDCIMSHNTTTCLTAQMLWRKKKIPYIAFVWDPMNYILTKVYSRTLLRGLFPFLSPFVRKIEYSFLRDATLVLTGSNVHSEFLHKKHDIDSEILYPGCVFSKKIPEKRGDHMLALTRWDNDKKPHMLLDLIRNLPDAKLMMVGTWTKKDDYKEFLLNIQKYNLQDRVKIIDSFGDNTLSDFGREARFFIHPNFEAFGMGALELAAHGCPMIIPKGSGVGEIFQNDVHGLFPEKENYDQFEIAVTKLLNDERCAYEMGRSAWKRAKEYSWENHARCLLNYIKKAVV